METFVSGLVMFYLLWFSHFHSDFGCSCADFLPVLLLPSGQRAVVGTEPWLEPVMEQAWAEAVKKGRFPAPRPQQMVASAARLSRSTVCSLSSEMIRLLRVLGTLFLS